MPRLEEMYAYIVEDSGPDDEGILGITTVSREEAPIGLPLVGADIADENVAHSITLTSRPGSVMPKKGTADYQAFEITVVRGRAVEARVSHCHQVVGSNPTPATKPTAPGE